MFRKNSGSALITALAFTAVSGLAVVGVGTFAVSSYNRATVESNYASAVNVADAGVNVEMVSYGMKSISLTMLIADRDVARAVSMLHARLFEG